MTHNLEDGGVTDFGGTTTNLISGDEAGRDLAIQGYTASLLNNGRWFQVEVDMSLYKDLVLTLAARRSGTGFTNNMVEYSINGGDFELFQEGWTPLVDVYRLETFDFRSITDMNGATSVIIRITLDGATASTGNNRFDNFQFSAVPLASVYYYEVTDGDLTTVSALNELWWSFNVYDAESGIARGTFNGGSNMMVTVDGLFTNNTSRFVLDRSTASTIIPTSTSIWEYAEDISYNWIGALYDDGQSNRPIISTFADIDGDRDDDSLWVSNQLFGVWRVIDDDTNAPVVAAGGANLLLNPGFEIGDAGYGAQPDNWWHFGSSGNEGWAARTGTTGYGFWSWGAGDWAFFGQDAPVSLDAGDEVTFTIWGLAQEGFASSGNEAYIKLEFFSGPTMMYVVTNHIYNQMIGNYDEWTQYSFTFANTTDGITMVKPIVGSGGWDPSGSPAVMWDDATFVKSSPLRLFIGNEEKFPVEGSGTNVVFELTDREIGRINTASTLTDPSFELGFTHYTMWDSGGNVFRGSGDAAETGTNGIAFTSSSGAYGGCYQDVPGEPGVEYTVSVRARKQENYSANTYVKLEFKDGSFVDVGGTTEVNINSVLNSAWQTYRVSGTAPAGTVYVRATLIASDGAGLAGTDLDAHFDNLRVNPESEGPLQLVFTVHDAESGLSRGTTDSASQMNVTVENLTTSDVANYDNGASTPFAQTRYAGAFSTWTFDTYPEPTGQWIDDMINEGSNLVSATVYDADNDRPDDRMSVPSQPFGWIRVRDNDTNAPVLGVSGVTNLLRNPGFEEEGSDIYTAWGWEYDNPDVNAGGWGNTLRATWLPTHGGSAFGTIPGRWDADDWPELQNENGGWWQQASNRWAAGTVSEAGAWVWNDDGSGDNPDQVWTSDYAAIKIEFRSAADVNLGENTFSLPQAGYGETWTWVSVLATAPVDTAWARIIIYADGLPEGTNSGALRFDDAVIRPLVPFGVQVGNRYIRPDDGDTSVNANFTLTDRDPCAPERAECVEAHIRCLRGGYRLVARDNGRQHTDECDGAEPGDEQCGALLGIR